MFLCLRHLVIRRQPYRKFYLSPNNFTSTKFANFPKSNRFQRSPAPSPAARSPTDGHSFQNLSPLGDFVSVSQIKQKLTKCGHIFEEGHACLILDCFLCGQANSKLYINKVTGDFICFICRKSGVWSQLEPHLSAPSDSPISLDQSIELGCSGWYKISKHLCPVGRLTEEERISVSQLLDFEDLPWNILESQGVMFDQENQDLYWPLSLPEGGSTAGYKILSRDLSESCYPHTSANGLVRLKSPGPSKSAIIVPSLRDLLALSFRPLDGTDVVCLPHGPLSLPPLVLPLLEGYEKLTFWFNDDVTSWDNARLFARKLSIDRCHLIRPSKEHVTAFVAHKRGMNIAETVRNARAMSHDSIITFAQLREDLHSELYSADRLTGIKWQRFPTLNSILQGHRRGELTILTGPTGSGKTTFMSEYSLDLAMQKVTTLWGSFEIRNQRLARTMLQQMACAPLQHHRDKFDEWADRFTLLPIYFMTFHGQQQLETVLDTVRHAAYVHDVAHVIIDNVQFMLGMSSSESGFLDRFYRQDALIGEFRNFATTYNCHVTLVIHPRKERDGESLSTNSIFGGAKASQEADNVLIIQHKMSNSGLKIRKYLQVAKNRFSGDLGVIPLEFDKDSLSFGAKNLQ
ncbi:chromosome 10 open reading frame 2 [Nesidiocoris tenuis]|uniref:Chromosome 10 open reading frame 2 n=1 Tax=Nesidiocoris tenuis TaxID=355587 RepID=A0ABN7B6H2_9HEMI|nr:chromosome 10 open reading frame 2 [Nesidiocoris tenuis]